MAVFTKKAETPQKDIGKDLSLMTHRINDLDRRLRVTEQSISNQHTTVTNMNDNLVKDKQDSKKEIESVRKNMNKIATEINSIEQTLEAIQKKIENIPSAAQLSMLSKKNAATQGAKGDLDMALTGISDAGLDIGESDIEETK